MKRHIQDGWLDFERQVLPNDAGDEQRDDMRKAFFAGALMLLGVLNDDDDTAIDDVVAELEAYNTSLIHNDSH